MTDLLFDPPWYFLATFLLAAVVLLYTGNARQDRRLMAAGVAALLVGLVIYGLGRLVETDREKVLRETNEVAAAVDKRNWSAFAALLDPQVRFSMYVGRDQLTSGAQKTVEQVGIKNISLGAFEAVAEPGGYTVSFMATADIDVTGQRTPTNWKFYWSKAGDKFLLYRIEPLPSAIMGTEPVTSRLARP